MPDSPFQGFDWWGQRHAMPERVSDLPFYDDTRERWQAPARDPGSISRLERPGDPMNPAHGLTREAEELGDRKASWLDKLVAAAGIGASVTQGKTGRKSGLPPKLRQKDVPYVPPGERPARYPGPSRGYAPHDNRELDPAGFYSHQLEAIKSMAREGRQQGSAEAWRKELAAAGVKPIEMQATGMDRFLASKPSHTREELEAYARSNRPNLQETRYGPVQYEVLRSEDGAVMDGPFGSEREAESAQNRYRNADDLFIEGNHPPDTVGDIKWKHSGGQNLLLDPENPSNREVVLHEPPNPRLAEIDARMKWIEANQAGYSQRLVTTDPAKAAAHEKIGNEYDALREERFKLRGQQYTEPHFDDAPGSYLAHLRMGDYVTAKGEKTKLGDEWQSTRAQKRRDEGPLDQVKVAASQQKLNDLGVKQQAAMEEARQFLQTHDPTYVLEPSQNNPKSLADIMAHTGGRRMARTSGLPHENLVHATNISEQISQLQSDINLAQAEHKALTTKSVPSHPFTDDMGTTNLLMARKHLIEAQRSGVAGVSLTPGDLQNERYNLSKYVGALRYSPEGQSLQYLDREVAALPPVRRDHRWLTFGAGGHKPEDLPGLVGKEMADRLLQAPTIPMGGGSPYEAHTLHNLGSVEIGGAGMRDYYDRQYPETMTKELRRLDRKHPGREQTQLFAGEDAQGRTTVADRRVPFEGGPFHHWPLTEEAKAQIAKGLPYFSLLGGLAGSAAWSDMASQRDDEPDNNPFGP